MTDPVSIGTATLDLSVDVAGALRKAARDLLDAANKVETNKLEAPAPDGPPVQRTIDAGLLLSSADAHVWALEFQKIQPAVDPAVMVTWFSNLIATAQTVAKVSLARQIRAMGITAPEQVTNTVELGTFYRDAIASLIENAS